MSPHQCTVYSVQCLSGNLCMVCVYICVLVHECVCMSLVTTMTLFQSVSAADK